MTRQLEDMDRVVLIGVIVAVLSCQCGAAKEGKYYCSGLRPLKNITPQQVSGEWITLNELLFKDGIPAAPLPGETVRHNVCIRHQVSTNSSHLGWATFFNFAKGMETRNPAFAVASKPNGRWKLHTTDGKAMQGGRMLFLAGDPNTYLVRAMCFPEVGKNQAGGSKKRKPLVLKSVSVESRRIPGQEGRGNLDAERLLTVKGQLATMLGLKEFKPAQFGLYC